MFSSDLFAASPEEEAVDAVLSEHASRQGRFTFHEAAPLAQQLGTAGLLTEKEVSGFASWLEQGVTPGLLREFLIFLRRLSRPPALPVTPASIGQSPFFTGLVAQVMRELEGRTGTNHWGYYYVAQYADQVFGTHGEVGELLWHAMPSSSWAKRHSASEVRRKAVEILVRAQEALDAFSAARTACANARPFAECQPGWRVTWLSGMRVVHGTCVRLRTMRETETWVSIVVDPSDNAPPSRHHTPVTPVRWFEDGEWRELRNIEVVEKIAGSHLDRHYFCEEVQMSELPGFPVERFVPMVERLLRNALAMGADVFDAARDMAQAAYNPLWQGGTTELCDEALSRAIAADPVPPLRAHIDGYPHRFLDRTDLKLLEPLIQAIAACSDPEEIMRLIAGARLIEEHLVHAPAGAEPEVQRWEHTILWSGYNEMAYGVALAATDDVKLIARTLAAFGGCSGPVTEGSTTRIYGRIVCGLDGRKVAYPSDGSDAIVAEPEPDDAVESDDECYDGCDLDDEKDDGEAIEEPVLAGALAEGE